MKTKERIGAAAAALERIRERIDQIDEGLIDLMAARLELALEAAEVKTAGGMAQEDLAREAAIVRRATALARDRGLEAEATREVFWKLMALSRAAQRRNGGTWSP
jgi:chorismate mutase